MQFNSLSFLCFFPAVAVLYFLTPSRFRWLLLLAASLTFYAAFLPAHLLVLLAAVSVDYVAGRAIDRSAVHAKRYLILSITVTVMLLLVFKYLDFADSTLGTLAKLIHWNYSVKALHILLPVGLSFYKLQSLSYVIEVYRGRQKAERHFGIYALYVSFFPQLIAGPIERPYNMLHQYHEEHPFEYKRVTDGLKLMAWGFFKKVVIADRLALIVNQVYDTPANYTGLPLILAVIFFAYQIYCDFSGYSDIAIGAAQVFGIRIMENFQFPYGAKSISDFWKRWHISLSSWLRDYIFLPLTFSLTRRIKAERILAIGRDVLAYSAATIITMFIAGLWHGANWTYLIWGLLFGIYMSVGVWTRKLRKALVRATRIDAIPGFHTALSILFTFFLVNVAWIFFRANSAAEGYYIATHAGSITLDQWNELLEPLTLFASHLKHVALHLVSNQDPVTFDTPLKQGQRVIASVGNFVIAVASIFFIELAGVVQRQGDVRERLASQPPLVRWGAYYALIMAIIVLGVFEAPEQFIYFQF